MYQIAFFAQFGPRNKIQVFFSSTSLSSILTIYCMSHKGLMYSIKCDAQQNICILDYLFDCQKGSINWSTYYIFFIGLIQSIPLNCLFAWTSVQILYILFHVLTCNFTVVHRWPWFSWYTWSSWPHRCQRFSW